MAQHARPKIEARRASSFLRSSQPIHRGTRPRNAWPTACGQHSRPKWTGPGAAHMRQTRLQTVAAAFNSRPGKTLDWKTPAEALDRFLLVSRR